MLTCQKGKLCLPGGCNANKPQSHLVTENMKCKYQWLNRLKELLDKEKLEEKEFLSGHFASLQIRVLWSNAITSLFTPLRGICAN